MMMTEDERAVAWAVAWPSRLLRPDIPVKVTGDRAPEPITSFAASTLDPALLKNIEKSGYKVPTPVQKYSIPIIREKVIISDLISLL